VSTSSSSRLSRFELDMSTTMALRMEQKRTLVVIVTRDKQGCALARYPKYIISLSSERVLLARRGESRISRARYNGMLECCKSFFFLSPTQHIRHVRVIFHVVVQSASLYKHPTCCMPCICDQPSGYRVLPISESNSAQIRSSTQDF
jgi:hypothetical protein